MNSITAVRKRIKMLMQAKNMTWNSLSIKCGVSPSSLKSIFYKRAKSTTIHTITLICDGLDISVKEFFNHELFEDLYDLE